MKLIAIMLCLCICDSLKEEPRYEATIYRDADQSHFDTNSEVYVIEKKTVNKKTKLNIKLANGGGCAISLMKK